MIFDSQRNEYLVVCGKTWTVTYWHVNADGYQVGDETIVGFGQMPAFSAYIESVDMASSGGGTGLVVWSDTGAVRAQRIGLDGTRQGGTLDIAASIIAIEHNPAVTYDATQGAYIVTWQQDSEIWARTITPSGSLGDPFQVSDDAGKEFDPDVAYSPLTGQTLVVWSSDEEGDSQVIQARRLAGGVPVSPVFMVSQTPEINQLPRVVASENSNWVVTWQRTVPSSDDKGDIWLSPVPSDAGGDLTTSNRSIRVTSDSQTRPSVALRYDAVPMVALVETTSVGSAIVLVIDTPAPVGDYAWHYEYDDLGRMTFACTKWYNGDCQGNQWQYSHDAAGNLLLFEHWDAEHGTTVIAQYVINGANQIECIDDTSGDGKCDDGEFPWVYDAYGHLRNDGETQYTYDAAGRLVETILEGDKTTYVYNGDGERVRQSVDFFDTAWYDTVTTYTLDVATSALLSETTTSNEPNTSTTHYLNGLALIAQADGDTTAYFQYDGAGSVRQMVDANGHVLRTQTFDPYGNLYLTEETSPSTIDRIFGFVGGSHDTNGLVYFQGRYYSPTQGRGIWRGIQQDIDWNRRHIFSKFNWGGPPDTQPAPSTPVDWSKAQQFFSSLPSTAGEALPPFAITAFRGVIVEPTLWVSSMVSRQNQIMNYDTYYAPYGEAGKYLRVQDMMRQTGDIANAAFAAFDAITWWNGIGTETIIARQALAPLELSADEYALLGKIARLTKWQQLQEGAAATSSRLDDVVLLTGKEPGLSRLPVPSEITGREPALRIAIDPHAKTLSAGGHNFEIRLAHRTLNQSLDGEYVTRLAGGYYLQGRRYVGPPVRAVLFEQEGILTIVDTHKIVAARWADVSEVPIHIVLPEQRVSGLDFLLEIDLGYPATWGEAVANVHMYQGSTTATLRMPGSSFWQTDLALLPETEFGTALTPVVSGMENMVWPGGEPSFLDIPWVYYTWPDF